MSPPWFLLALLLLISLWLVWRSVRLRRDVLALARQLQEEREPTSVTAELDTLAAAIHARLTSLQQQLAALDAERARLATILEQLSDGVLITDPEGRVQFANPAARRLFGASPLGRSVVEVLRHHVLIEAWQRCRQTGEMQSETVELPLTRRFLHLIVMSDQHAGGSLLLIQDLTRIRRLETVRRDFISNLSHELRTPLASLKALTETLQDGAIEDPAAARRFLSRIQTEVEALARMVQDLLDLSRLEARQEALELAPIGPRALLDSAAERMRLQAERAGLTLRVESASDLPPVHADRARLEQVLVNLIHNAVKFTRPGGEIALSAEAGAGGVRFAVRDTGMGIPQEELPRIFERFYRVDKSRSGGGSGLGLSIARHIVEAHGGRIWAESREGEGSTFYFTIPEA